MAEWSIPTASQERLQTERRSQTEGGNSQVVHFQGVAPIGVGVAPRPEPRYLVNGASSDMGVDGTGGINFDLVPGTNEVLRVLGVRLTLRSTSALSFANIGGVSPAGGTGIKLQITDGAAITHELLAGDEVLAIRDLLPHASRFELFDSSLILVADLMFPSIARLVDGSTLFLRASHSADLSPASIATLTMLALVANETELL